MFKAIEIAEAAKTEPPAGAEAVIRYMLGRPLDFDPGTKYAYSNFGYNVLGRIIEKVSGQSYGAYVQARVLAKAGAMHLQLGRSLAADRLPDEVVYYPFASAPSSRSVFPPLKAEVPPPYGGFHLEAMDAHGAWLAHTIDYVRLLGALDGSRGAPLLAPSSIDLLTARPAAPVSVDAAAYYGLGIQVRPVRGAGTGANWWHSGSLPGSMTYAVRLASGWSWAAFFNSRPRDSRPFQSEIDRSINAALAAVTPPSSGDLFTELPLGKK
jgi:CubicO group peptidase (beta-lactamase class C family)